MRNGLQGVSGHIRDHLIQRTLERRLQRLGSEPTHPPQPDAPGAVPEEYCRFDLHPAYRQTRLIREGAARLGIEDPYFRAHEGVAGALTRIAGREYVNFASYNYLGLAGDPRVARAAKEAIDRYGTSVSASRLVSGERPLHRELELALARTHDAQDCLVFVSGHATNVSTIGCLFGPKDLILHDALIHNSALAGMQLAGARRAVFPHNDWEALEQILARERREFERVLVVVEGIYSMDGDFPCLPRFVEIKRRHRAFLMVDEAHSFGVMGSRGLGIGEHFGLAGADVDIWMGTLSKALAGCGGYICGSRALIEILRHAAPGFLYSVGMAPPLAAAALAALECLQAEPRRVRALQARGRLFLARAREAGVDTGAATGLAVIPAVTGSSIKAARLAQALFARGINVQPIIYPAVPENAARLRYFVSCQHTEEQIAGAADALAAELQAL